MFNMSKNFSIANHALDRLIDRGIIQPGISCKQIRQYIYIQCQSAMIYQSNRSIIYIYGNVEYVFCKNTLITSIVH